MIYIYKSKNKSKSSYSKEVQDIIDDYNYKIHMVYSNRKTHPTYKDIIRELSAKRNVEISNYNLENKD